VVNSLFASGGASVKGDLLHKIESAYKLSIKSWQILRDTKKTLVIRLHTDRGIFYAKSMFITKERQKFILDAEQHLRQRGISIPAVEKTADQKPFIMWQGYPLLLQKHVPGKPYSLKTADQIRRIGQFLAHLHRSSSGFHADHGDRYNGAARWEQEYADDLARMKRWWEEHKDENDPKINVIRSRIPFFWRAGGIAQNLLHRSSYFLKWKTLPEREHFLCHGDFHMRNVISSGRKLTVIDWEDVRFDFPSKDLTRLLSVLMRRDRTWSRKRCMLLLNAYLRRNRLDRKAVSLLYQDLAFPHIMERFLRRQLYTKMSLPGIRRFLRMEQQKTRYMLQKAKARG
jgi:CotS family spore coat protein